MPELWALLVGVCHWRPRRRAHHTVVGPVRRGVVGGNGAPRGVQPLPAGVGHRGSSGGAACHARTVGSAGRRLSGRANLIFWLPQVEISTTVIADLKFFVLCCNVYFAATPKH